MLTKARGAGTPPTPHIRRLRPAWLRRRGLGLMDIATIAYAIDRICGQFAAALQHAQLQVYCTVALVVILSVMLFPPKDDPDQI